MSVQKANRSDGTDSLSRLCLYSAVIILHQNIHLFLSALSAPTNGLTVVFDHLCFHAYIV